jgi:hypothetical protein
MAWVTPTTRTTGHLMTAAEHNQDTVENPIALRTGALALTNQVQGNFLVAESASQWSAQRDEQLKFFVESFT